MIQRICFILFVSLFSLSTLYGQRKRSSEMQVIAYYTGNSETIDQYSIEKITQLIFSFGHLDGNRFHLKNMNDTLTIQKLVMLKKRNPGLKILLSLGGWGGCSTCSAVFSTKTGRKEFTHSVKEILRNFDADGIDLDWEYPAIAGFPGHTYSADDRKNFTSLVHQLRKKLGRKAIISFAAGGFDQYLQNSIDWKKVMPVINYVNLMSYDLVSGYSTVTGHHSGLYSTEKQKQSIDNAISFFKSIDAKLNKIIIGAAFYARGWDSVSNENNGLFQAGMYKHFIPYKSFNDRLSKDSGFVYFTDSAALAPYAYNHLTKTFATFDNEYSVREKVNYIKKMKLGGIMFWELTLDKPVDGLLDVIDREKRRN